ncbi:glycerol dehydratase reactivase beta/small subunit family protein [Halanaerobium hydrogeniformans]|uniref:Dehydratase medium subunit n=1 Tax=Halanaerobium hydrogeniformans TaxID=656519 RepID=E4RMA1_HALHG|nr:glycerol dehydratase reactivase beta/small subunit family protein [Halanaerobium hydrogeniformans]ADQ14432.1 hypothetical protein Halsa_0988 [Halanaerobium hydrogeniformans]
MSNQSQKPSVNIGVQKEYEENSLFRNLCYGLEEEGIPYQFFLSDDKNVHKLANDAANESRLNVGVGIGDQDNIIIQHKKLNIDQPFLEKKVDEDFQAKIMGSNAARLVKGIPIKDIPLEDEYSRNSIPEQKREDIVKEINKANDTAKNTTTTKINKETNNETKEEKPVNQAQNAEINSDDVERITKLVLEALKDS